jgi:hypothetical protein
MTVLLVVAGKNTLWQVNTVKSLFIVFVGGSEKETMDPGKQ